jgi:hypothetical protein
MSLCMKGPDRSRSVISKQMRIEGIPFATTAAGATLFIVD